MMKQRMLQKNKILKTWRFVSNNIHLQKWRLKKSTVKFKHLEKTGTKQTRKNNN